MSGQDERTEVDTQRRARLVKRLVLLLVIVATVFVLFTWVFPWITELGFSPALDV